MKSERQTMKPWEDTRRREGVPEICTRCGQWLPMFFTVVHKECAVFGTTDGVKNNACGAWTKRIEPPAL